MPLQLRHSKMTQIIKSGPVNKTQSTGSTCIKILRDISLFKTLLNKEKSKDVPLYDFT